MELPELEAGREGGHEGGRESGREGGGRAYRQARTVTMMLAVWSIGLHSLGYLTLRFRFAAYGLEPEFSVVSETFLFEGARHLLFLLSLMPPFFFQLAPILVPLLLLAAVPAVRSWAEKRAHAATQSLGRVPPALVALAGLLWSSLVLREGRSVAQLEGLLFSGLPCEPEWLRQMAMSGSSEQASLIFGGLVLALAPTLWAVRSLWQSEGWRWAGIPMAGLATVQAMLIPLFFGVLIGPQWADRVEALADAPDAREIWLVASDESRHWFLSYQPGESGSSEVRELLVRHREETTTLNIVERRPFYSLVAGQCGPVEAAESRDTGG